MVDKSSSKNEKINQLLKTAIEQSKTQNLEAALLTLKSLLQIEPTHEIALGMLAGHYAQLGLTEKAKTQFQTLLSAHPKNTLAAFQLGHLYYQDNDYTSARSNWDVVFQNTKPDDVQPELDYYYADVLEKTGDNTRAMAHYNRCDNKLPLNHKLKHLVQSAISRIKQ